MEEKVAEGSSAFIGRPASRGIGTALRAARPPMTGCPFQTITPAHAVLAKSAGKSRRRALRGG
jgi:hypothetical protein